MRQAARYGNASGRAGQHKRQGSATQVIGRSGEGSWARWRGQLDAVVWAASHGGKSSRAWRQCWGGGVGGEGGGVAAALGSSTGGGVGRNGQRQWQGW